MPRSKVSDSKIDQQIQTGIGATKAVGKIAGSIFAMPLALAAIFGLAFFNTAIKISQAVIKPLPGPDFMKSTVNEYLGNISKRIEGSKKEGIEGMFWKPGKFVLNNIKGGALYFFPNKDKTPVVTSEPKTTDKPDKIPVVEKEQEEDKTVFDNDAERTTAAEQQVANERSNDWTSRVHHHHDGSSQGL